MSDLGDEWLRRVTASKVAAILGLSPWASPYSTWLDANPPAYYLAQLYWQMWCADVRGGTR